MIKNGFWWLVLLLSLACVSCQVETVSTPQLKLARYVITAKDVPPELKFSGDNLSKQFGGESYLVGYGEDRLESFGKTIIGR